MVAKVRARARVVARVRARVVARVRGRAVARVRARAVAKVRARTVARVSAKAMDRISARVVAKATTRIKARSMARAVNHTCQCFIRCTQCFKNADNNPVTYVRNQPILGSIPPHIGFNTTSYWVQYQPITDSIAAQASYSVFRVYPLLLAIFLVHTTHTHTRVLSTNSMSWTIHTYIQSMVNVCPWTDWKV